MSSFLTHFQFRFGLLETKTSHKTKRGQDLNFTTSVFCKRFRLLFSYVIIRALCSRNFLRLVNSLTPLWKAEERHTCGSFSSSSKTILDHVTQSVSKTETRAPTAWSSLQRRFHVSSSRYLQEGHSFTDFVLTYSPSSSKRGLLWFSSGRGETVLPISSRVLNVIIWRG